MSPFAHRLYGLVLRAYPEEFRRAYGDAMLQTVVDRHSHDGVSWWARQNRPIGSTASAHRWYGWLAAGLATVAIGIAIPAIDGGELSAAWWTVFALALLTGTAMTFTGVVLALNARPPQQSVH